jgi:hypothetical protein
VPAIQAQLAKALFNKACTLAMERRVVACIATLDQWAERRGGIDCDAITNDSDYDTIRTRPMFVKYLKSKGCLGQCAE